MDDTFLTPQQVADRLQVQVDTVYRWIKCRWLGAFRVGKLYRITEQQLEQFVADGATLRIS